jgi:hypothetical protein
MTDDFKTKRALADGYLRISASHVTIQGHLGGGTDGEVWKTSRDTAIKVFHEVRGYANERDSYLRLAEYGVTERINGFWVPKMVGHNDDLMVVEMDLMHNPPYIIDFAKVRIDRPPDFPEDVLREQDQRGQERFEHNWPAVKSLLAALESFMIYYLDPQRGNITFPDMP